VLAKPGHLREVERVKVCRFAFLVVTIGAAFPALSGCGQRPEPTDSSLTEVQPSTNAKPGWITSYEQGQQEAKASHKLMLLDFTGSDWCGWCKLLEREVFSKPEFKEYASKNLVLVEVDFPKMKPMPDAIRAQNVRLAQRYQVQGFPTIIVLNDDGQKVGEFGYMQGGPDAFIAVLEKLRKG
jgi:thioredoxin-related protein